MRSASFKKHLVLCLGIVLATAHCRGCNESAPPTLLHMAPPTSPAVIWLADLGRTVAGLQQFANHATQKGGGAALKRLHTAVVGHLGFDPLSPEDYAKAGIQTDKGLLLFKETPTDEPILALGISDRDKFDRAFKELLTQSDGADSIQTTHHAGHAIITAGRPFGSEIVPSVHWSYLGPYVLLTGSKGLPAMHKALERMTPTKPANEHVLATDPLFVHGQKHVAPGHVFVFVNPESGNNTTNNTAIVSSISLDGTGIRCDTFMGLPIVDLQGALGTEPTLLLADRIDTDAVMVLLTRAAKPAGLRALRQYPPLTPWLNRALAIIPSDVSLDVERDILGNLSGPLTLSVHAANLAQNLATQLKSWRGPQSLLELVQVAMVAELSNAQAMQTALETLSKDLKHRGVAVRARPHVTDGKAHLIYEPDVENPRIGWTVFDKYYVYGAGAGRLDATLTRLTQGPSGLPATLQKSVGGVLASQAGSVAILRGAILAEGLQGITMGNDPTTRIGTAAVIASANEMLRTLGDLAVGLSAEADGLRVQVREQLQ
jgi:hypothetical protein